MGTPTEEPLQLIEKRATSLATSPYLPNTDLLHECFYVSNDSIKRLKMSLMQECGSETLKESFTTIEVLGAYVWRSRFRALKLNLDGKIMFWLIVEIRNILNRPLPVGYYGNAFASAKGVILQYPCGYRTSNR